MSKTNLNEKGLSNTRGSGSRYIPRFFVFLGFGFLVWLLPVNSGRATKFAGEYLNLGAGARSLGMGSAFVAVADDITAGYWNPAGLATLTKRQAIFMHAETFGALLNHDYLAFGMPFGNPEYNGYGSISLVRLGGGGIKFTALRNPDSTLSLENRPRVIKVASHADYALYASYALQRWSRLRIGASTKILWRDLGDNSAFGMGIDLGTQAQVHTYVTLAANLRDATATFLAYDTGTKQTISPTLRFGPAIRYPYRYLLIILSADAELNFEGRQQTAQYWQGEISADTHYGLEVLYQQVVAFRLGADVGKFTAGLGVHWQKWNADIAYLAHPDLNNIYRASITLTW